MSFARLSSISAFVNATRSDRRHSENVYFPRLENSVFQLSHVFGSACTSSREDACARSFRLGALWCFVVCVEYSVSAASGCFFFPCAATQRICFRKVNRLLVGVPSGDKGGRAAGMRLPRAWPPWLADQTSLHARAAAVRFVQHLRC